MPDAQAISMFPGSTSIFLRRHREPRTQRIANRIEEQTIALF